MTGSRSAGVRPCLQRLGFALVVALAQVLAGAAMGVIWWLPGLIATAAEVTDWLTLEYFVVGALVAVATAAVTGAFTAARFRLPLHALYSVPVLLPAASQWLTFNSSFLSWERYGLLTFIGGNLLIALATVRRPRRAARPKRDRAPLPSA
jgi:hypothetical protein